jgi:RND family efflux transporter MFP subunit
MPTTPTSTETSTPGTPSPNGELIDRVQRLRLDNQLGRGPATGRGSWLPWVLCGLMAVAWVGVGVRYLRTRSADPAGGAPGAAANPGTPSGAASAPGQPAAPGELLLHLKGTVTPFLQINLSPDDVSGVVEEIFFKEGDRVKQGKLLARIRKARYENDHNSAQAALLSAEARWKKAQADIGNWQAQIALAETELRRVNSPGGGFSQADRDRAQSTLDVNKAQLESARASVIAAEHEVTSAKARVTEAVRLLKNCEVLAPIDGTILTKAADRGMLVSPMSFNVAVGICSMADLSKLEVEIDVPERQHERVKPGMDCLIQPDANPNRGYRGVVDRVMPIADDTKGVVKVRLRVILPLKEQPGTLLKPKMSVTATVYNRPFEFNPATDQPWDEEKK